METLEKVVTVCKKLNVKKKFVMELIKNNSVSYEIRGGSYYVSQSEIKEYLKKVTNCEEMVLPSLIKKIFIETQKDFDSSQQQLGFSPLPSKQNRNIKKIVYEISNGRDTLTNEESQTLYNQSKKSSKEFTMIEKIDYDRLENDTMNYYNELYKKYFDRWCYYGDYKSSVKCEKFILNHYLLENYDIDKDFEDGINYHPSDEEFNQYIREEKKKMYQSNDGFTDDEFNSLINDLQSKGIGVTVIDLT